MASGTFYGTTDNKYVQPKIVWSSSPNIEANTSTVTASLYYSRTNTGYTTYGTGQFSITIGGVSSGVQYRKVTLTYNSNTLALTHTVTVPHNSDGTKSVYITASGFIPGTSFGEYTSIGETVTLDTIPRASSFSLSPSTVSAGSSMTVSIVRHSASFTHRVSYTFGGASAVVASAAGTSATFQLPMSLLHQIPNAISGTGSIRVETYSGGTLIGSAVSQSFTLTAPASVAPSFSLSVSRVDGNVPAGWGVYVQGQSKAAISVENPAGAYGSTIRQYSISGAGYSSSAQHYTTGLLNRTGSQTISATVTDSRGRSTTKLQTITIEPYALPGITAMAVQRCNADGALNDEGTCCRLTYAISVSSVGGRNIHSASYEARVSGQSGWSPLVVLSPGEPWAVLKPGEGSGLGENFSADQSYDIRMTVTDQIGSVARTAVLSTAPTTMDFKRGGKGVAIGKVAETDNLFEVAWNTKIHGNLEATGTIVATGTAGAPIRIPAHSDLNDYRAIGDYYNELNADAETMAGAPFGQAFYLEVRKIGGIVLQRIYSYTAEQFFIRYRPSWGEGQWSAWVQH